MKNHLRGGILCFNCRKLIHADEPSCPYCGILHPGAKWNIHRLSLLFKQPDLLLKMLLILNVGMFTLSLLFPPAFSLFENGLFMILSPSDKNLICWGASGTVLSFSHHGYWSFISAIYLHGSLLHIFFNLMALKAIGPWVLKEFGSHRMFIIYSLSGVMGYLLSYLAGIQLTIGASGAIFGLMGAGIFFGLNRGGTYGQLILKQFGGWALGLLILGLFMRISNNWAHGGGLITGFITAFILGYEERRKILTGQKIVSYVILLFTFFALFRAIGIGIYYLMKLS